jgi:hypothetical protein
MMRQTIYFSAERDLWRLFLHSFADWRTLIVRLQVRNSIAYSGDVTVNRVLSLFDDQHVFIVC